MDVVLLLELVLVIEGLFWVFELFIWAGCIHFQGDQLKLGSCLVLIFKAITFKGFGSNVLDSV